jgi:hypothetical protein
MVFLKVNSPDVERTIRDYYVAIMSRIYLENFKLLARRVLRQMVPISTADETLVPISVVRGFFSTKVVVGGRTPFWEMRDRFRFLNEMLSPPQPYSDDQYPIESLVRALYQILIDAVTAEDSFASDFMSDDAISLHIFHATTQYLEQFMLTLLKQVTDPIAVLFFLRFNFAHQEEMGRRNVLKLEQHLTAVRLHLTERFKALAASNLSAVTSCNPAVLVGGEQGPRGFVERFRDFAFSASFLLSADVADVVTPALGPLSDAVNALIVRLAAVISVQSFLVNAYSMIVRGLAVGPRSDVLAFYENQLNVATAQYLDGQIESQLPELVRVIRGAFAVLDSSDPPTNTGGLAEAELRDIGIDFRDRHRQKVKAIVESQHGLFDTPEAEKEVLTKLAKRLTLYWAKFIQLCKVVLRPQPQWYS